MDVHGIGGISETAALAPADFDAVPGAAGLTCGADLVHGANLAYGADELPYCDEETGVASDLVDTAALPIVRSQELKGQIEKRAGGAEIRGAAKRRSFADLALASGTGKDVVALIGGARRRRRRLNQDNARAVLTAAAACLVAVWAWLVLTRPDGDRSQSKLVEKRGSALALCGVGRSKASNSANSCETGEKPALESRDGGESGSGSAGGSAGSSSIVVYVSGAIKASGAYTFAAGSHVDDAVRVADGLTEHAESAGANLAVQFSDGEYAHVAATGESIPLGALGSSSGSDAAGGRKGARASGEGVGKKAAAGQKAGTTKVNADTAGAGELQTLPGVGPATVEAIIAWCREDRRFRSVDGLLDVPSTGEATLARLRDHISVQHGVANMSMGSKHSNHAQERAFSQDVRLSPLAFAELADAWTSLYTGRAAVRWAGTASAWVAVTAMAAGASRTAKHM